MATASTKKPARSKPAATKEIEFGSLAVKYRPRILEDLVGQDKIVTQLRGMLKSRKMPHAFLITGNSGLGKTTTARLIARYVNCHNPNPETHAPCEECPSCMYDKESPDITYLNAAETRGIDDIRALIQGAKNSPTLGKYRVIMLDECHQLTPQAREALLVPLEEPPKRTLWILSTTNPEKLTVTMRSRCTHLAIANLDEKTIVSRLYRIAKREGTDFKQIEGGVDILKTIANYSNGLMRESIARLENVMYALESGEDFDTKTIIDKFVAGDEADLDALAANALANVLTADTRSLIAKIRSTDDARGIMYKLRFLVQYLIDNAAKCAKFAPNSAKIFSAACQKNGIKPSLQVLFKLQLLLLEMEVKFNSLSVEESVVMLTMLADFSATYGKRDKQ